MDWVTVYEFAEDRQQIQAMQQASRERPDLGLSLKPALIASPDWWNALRDGALRERTVEGTISRVYWGSMGDWPEFEITTADGDRSTWTRQADISRYVEGLRARLSFVLHPWKVPDQHGLGKDAKIVLRVEIEASDRRSDPRAPGPLGVGTRGRR
jgi:hypothetical protein